MAVESPVTVSNELTATSRGPEASNGVNFYPGLLVAVSRYTTMKIEKLVAAYNAGLCLGYRTPHYGLTSREVLAWGRRKYDNGQCARFWAAGYRSGVSIAPQPKPAPKPAKAKATPVRLYMLNAA